MAKSYDIDEIKARCLKGTNRNVFPYGPNYSFGLSFIARIKYPDTTKLLFVISELNHLDCKYYMNSFNFDELIYQYSEALVDYYDGPEFNAYTMGHKFEDGLELVSDFSPPTNKHRVFQCKFDQKSTMKCNSETKNALFNHLVIVCEDDKDIDEKYIYHTFETDKKSDLEIFPTVMGLMDFSSVEHKNFYKTITFSTSLVDLNDYKCLYLSNNNALSDVWIRKSDKKLVVQKLTRDEIEAVVDDEKNNNFLKMEAIDTEHRQYPVALNLILSKTGYKRYFRSDRTLNMSQANKKTYYATDIEVFKRRDRDCDEISYMTVEFLDNVMSFVSKNNILTKITNTVNDVIMSRHATIFFVEETGRPIICFKDVAKNTKDIGKIMHYDLLPSFVDKLDPYFKNSRTVYDNKLPKIVDIGPEIGRNCDLPMQLNLIDEENCEIPDSTENNDWTHVRETLKNI